MAGYTPPKIEDAPKSFIGVGTRELVIAAAGIILAVLVYLSDIFAPLKIGLAIICAGIGIGIAFGRDPKTGRKFEEMITQILMFYGRDKFHQKGIDHVEKYDYSERKPEKPKKEPKRNMTTANESLKSQRKNPKRCFICVRSTSPFHTFFSFGRSHFSVSSSPISGEEVSGRICSVTTRTGAELWTCPVCCRC